MTFEKINQEYNDLKSEIQRVKERIEQVDMFGLQRDDYYANKKRAIEIIARLREIEKDKLWLESK